jgi:hypothetical protein
LHRGLFSAKFVGRQKSKCLSRKDGKSAADETKKSLVYEKTHALLSAFEQEFGSIRCRDLTGCNMLTEEGMKQVRARKPRT